MRGLTDEQRKALDAASTTALSTAKQGGLSRPETQYAL
jgi:hypothetical protein